MNQKFDGSHDASTANASGAFRLTWRGHVVLCGFATLLAACSDSGGRGQSTASEPAPPHVADSTYSIKAYFKGENGEERLVQFAPAGAAEVTDDAKPFAAPAPTSKPASADEIEVGTSREALTVTVPGQPNDVDLEALLLLAYGSIYATSGFQPVWYLQKLALLRCLQSAGYNTAPNVYGTDPFADASPWAGSTAWHLFQANGVQSCDGWLAVQETLLCTADQMAELADAVAPVTWTNVSGTTVATFPPQAERDKFILRDMAVNLLAHVAYAEQQTAVYQGSPLTLTTLPKPNGCTGNYASMASNTWGTSNKAFLFDNRVTTTTSPIPFAHFPPAGVMAASANLADVAKQRLDYKTHLLRASSRLLKDLVEKSVLADRAGAEQQRAMAGGDLDGMKLMWGVGTNGTPPYNSLRHALHVLTGRLEIGPDYERVLAGTGNPVPPSSTADSPKRDPQCQGFRSLVLPTQRAINPNLKDGLDALGDGFSARWNDVAVSSSGEAMATALAN